MTVEKNIFDKIKAGDKKAYEQLFRSFYGPLCAFTYKYVKDRDTAEEIVQDILVGIWEKRAYLDITTSLKSYLYTSARNRSLNYLSKDKKHAEFNDEVSKDMVYSLKTDELTDDDLKNTMMKAVNTLPKRCGEIFKLCKFEGLSYKEIAEFMNISNKTVEAQMGIALKNLRIALKPLYKKLSQ